MGIITSTFDTGDEGWTVSGDAQGAGVTPNFHSAAGNPGGYVSATDNIQGGVWYWVAPGKFHGSQAASYGLSLTFDLQQSATTNGFVANDVILEGGGLRLGFRFDSPPGTAWTAYELRLDTSAAWQNLDTGQAATAADIRTALGSVSNLFIRGEYRSGADTGGLDNVVLQSNLTTGTAGADVIAGDQFLPNSADTVYGEGGSDTISGGGGRDRLWGDAGNDSLAGGNGNDKLIGGSGNDTLAGGIGNDILNGGAGRDVLSGNGGNDTFVYARAADSANDATRDQILGFTGGDHIDLSAIDADETTAGNQAFGGVSSGGAFSGSFAQPGELYYDQDNQILYGNTDADAAAEFSILVRLSGLATLVATDFVL